MRSVLMLELNWLLLMRWLNNITHSTNMNLGKPREMRKDRAAWCAAVQGVADSSTTESLDNNNVFIRHGVQIPRFFLQQKATLLLDNPSLLTKYDCIPAILRNVA